MAQAIYPRALREYKRAIELSPSIESEVARGMGIAAFHSESIPPFGANRAYLEDLQIDKLIESAEGESDLEEQIKHYHRLQERLHHVLPYIPLWYEHNILARQKNIKGYQLAVNGSYDSLITTYREPEL